MRRLLLLILSAGIACGATAQKRQLTGVVTDARSGEAVPFAVVEVARLRVGAQADQAGSFRLELPANMNLADSLSVSSLGYQRQQVTVPVASPCRILLMPLPPTQLQAVVIKPAAAVSLGAQMRRSQTGFSCSALTPERNRGWQVARFFAAPPVGTILSVSFWVEADHNSPRAMVQTPFRIRLYAADGPDGAPGTDLLAVSVVTAASKPGWHSVDLSSYQLHSRANGFYVAMEWIYTSDAYTWTSTYTQPPNREKKQALMYGQALGGNLTPTALTWYLSAGHPWLCFTTPARADKKFYVNAGIQAVVQPD